MRVLYFHQHFCTPEGSAGIRSYEMARYLLEKGHNVTMVFGKSSRIKSPLTQPYVKGMRRGTYEGIDLIEFDLNYSNRQSAVKRFFVFMNFAVRSVGLVFTEKFDLVFATSTPLTAAIPGIVMKMARKKKPFVFETRDLWPEGLIAVGVTNKPVLWFMEFLARQAYNRADSCIALSPGISDGIKRRQKKETPVYMIPNGCDLDLFTPGKEPKTGIKGIREDDFVAVFTGAHGFANGLHAALDAAAVFKTKPEAKNIKLLFVGDGVQKDELVQRAEKEALDNCIFIDTVPKKELVRIMKACDVGLMLLANLPEYYYGTSPNKFFDYISMGLPVLNNYPGWLAGMINEHNLGIAIDPENPELFANALIEMKNSPERLIQMGLNARKFAEKEFARHKLADHFVESLESTYDTYIKSLK